MPTLTSAHDLVTAVPFLIGFHPTDSLVVISIREGAIGVAMRIDIPTSLRGDEIDLLAHHVIRDGAKGALLIAYMPEERSDGDLLLISLGAGFMRNGIEIHESLVVSAGRYRSIMCRDSQCCPPSGKELPAIEGSQIAAEHVVSGIPMPYSDISELIASISADEKSFSRNWTLEVASFAIDEEDREFAELRRDGVDSMDLLLDEFRIGRGACNEILVARVIGRMADVQVRDYALGIHTEDTYDLYFTMWRELLRLAPKNFIAPIACIVASMAYENGDGALAQKAIDRALADQSDYPLALLLRRVFNAGWPPESFSAMRAELHPKVVATIFERATE